MKRTAAATSKSSAKRSRQGSGSAELSAYFKNYKNGVNDFHWPIFRRVKEIVEPTRVLYPGCHRHITASLVFDDIVYVDNYKKVEGLYKDSKALEWVDQNKDYDGPTKITFLCKNFESKLGEPASFELLISMSAGIVSTSCNKYLKKGGYFLASDAHFDARMLFVNSAYELHSVWDESKEAFDSSNEGLKGHFTTKNGDHITRAQVDESIEKPKAKRSFKLQKEALFYLFKKVK